MIMRLPSAATKLAETLQRLRRNSVVLEYPGSDDAEIPAPLQATTASIRLTTFEVDDTGRAIVTPTRLRFEKDRTAALVSVNPALLAILGYTPGIPAVLHNDNWPAEGQELGVALSKKLSEAERKAVDDLTWLLDLHVVVVGIA